MRKTDISSSYLNDMLIALHLLTRLPLPRASWSEETAPAKAAWAYPIAGLIVAALAGMVAWCALELGVPAPFAAGLALVCLVVATGAMHEDGLADCADGFWGGWDRERRLKIMKDSATGAFGVTAMILAYGLRWVALAALFADGWVFTPMIVAAVSSRAGMVWCMATLPNARPDGLSSTTGRPTLGAAGVASFWALLVCLVAFGPGAIVVLAVAGAAVVVWALVAMRKIRGQTGDVLGATQQICEVTLLGAMTALI